jgi:hypothetical protein
MSIWLKHFNHSVTPKSFDFISELKFVKHWLLPLYVNVGKNLTKGIYYKLNPLENDYKKHTFLIYDVPTYFNIEPFDTLKWSSLKLKSLYQYKGFLMDISNFKSSDDYINKQFSSKNRREFKSNQRRLETCFNISYEFINDTISKDKFDVIFNNFYFLLKKRFFEKHINYHHTNANKWAFYNELVFEMLKEQKASLLIIYNEKEPIGITLNFHSESILFEAITVFDPDYYKFSIGKTSIIKLLDWCFEHNYKISDFSKGDFDYKHKWGNIEYDFNYHILYDSKSIKSICTANFVELFFKVKLFLRRKNLNTLYRKTTFIFKRKKTFNEEINDEYKIEYIDNFEQDNSYKNINFKEEKSICLKQVVYTFLFANPEPLIKIKVFKNVNNPKEFIIKGSKAIQKITYK